MKTPCCILWLVLGLAGLVSRAADPITESFQKALFEEEANQNLPAAIQAYEAVIEATDSQRRLAATALFRLGECYRKLGQTNAAIAQYQRLLRDYADQTNLVTLSRQNLAGLGWAVASASTPVLSLAARVEQQRLLLEEIALAEQQLQALKSRLGKGLATEDDVLAKQREILALRRQLAALDLGSAPAAHTPPTDSAPTDEEAKEISRLQALMQNSPDLLRLAGTGYTPTPLMVAAQKGHLAVARFLLAAKADVNAKVGGQTALHWAVAAGQKSMTELLLTNGARINAQDQAGQSPLHIAADKGYRAVAEVLLAHQAEVNLRDNGGRIPLHVAAQAGHVEMAELLLRRGAEVNARDKDGATPLHLAATKGHDAVAALLLKHKAEVNATDHAGQTPLSLAAAGFLGDTALVQSLLAHGANVNAKSSDGMTPLLYAVEKKSLPMLEAVLAHKPDLEIRNRSGYTALALALSSRENKLAERLIQAGARVNAEAPPDFTGTLLHLAVLRGNKGGVELLLVHQAAVNALDKRGRTPLDLARENARNPRSDRKELYTEIATLLLKHGADENFTLRSRIEVGRESSGYRALVFLRGANDWNRYTLLELIAVAFAGLQEPPASQLQFPDLSRVTIRRLGAAGEPERRLTVDVLALLQARDCTNAPWLEWGDVVDIPEEDHPLNAAWPGLDVPVEDALVNCLRRELSVVIKGQSRRVVLSPVFRTTPLPPPSPAPVSASPRPARVITADPLRVGAFRLNQVLRVPGLLRVSSDLSRVRVKRADPASQRTVEWVVDLSQEQGYDTATDLWLRDGDVIEVPEK